MALKLRTADQLPVLPPKILGYGKTGTGKSTLIAKLLIGVREMLGWQDRPFYLLDSEERAQPLIANILLPAGLKAKQIEVAQTRSIYDARDLILLANEKGGTVMIDQATHLVDDLREAHKKKVKRDRLYIGDYGVLKPIFRKVFIDTYLYADVPVGLVARGKDDLKEEIDEKESDRTGKVETKLVNRGVEAKLDGDTAYEAYLNVLLQNEPNPRFKATARKSEYQKRHLVVAVVTKDNYGPIHARSFINPQFSQFKPHFEKMGIEKGIELRAERKPKETQPDDIKNIYGGTGFDKKKVEVLENIQAKCALIFPKQNKASRAMLGEVMNYISGTSSWSAWKSKSRKELELYLEYLSHLAEQAKSNVRLDSWDAIKGELDQIREYVNAQHEAQAKHDAEMDEALNGNSKTKEVELPFPQEDTEKEVEETALHNDLPV